MISNMPKTIKQLEELMVEQLKRRGFYPDSEKKLLLRLGEEVGEVFEAVREEKDLEDLSDEVADVLWILLQFCELRGIDIKKAFLEKARKNEKRPLPKPVTDISENA